MVDFVNLFALVQVAVVMNFGLVLIGTDNFYKKTRNEFKLYIDSLIGSTVKFAEQQLSNTSSYPLDISLRIKKANTADALHKLKSHANTDNVYSYYLACWGVFAGVYCLAFLFAIAFKGSDIESVMKDILIFMVFEILLFGIISYIILRNEHMPESKARHHIIVVLEAAYHKGMPKKLLGKGKHSQ